MKSETTYGTHRCNLHRWNVNLECRSLLRERTQGDRKLGKPCVRYGARSLLDRRLAAAQVDWDTGRHERHGISHERSIATRASSTVSALSHSFPMLRSAASLKWLATSTKATYIASLLHTTPIGTALNLRRCAWLIRHQRDNSAFSRAIRGTLY